MKLLVRPFFIVFVMLGLTAGVAAQVDEMCTEFGFTPSLDSPFAHVPYVFGRVTVNGNPRSAKPPRVTVKLVDMQQTPLRISVGKSGNYCFKRTGSGGTIVVEVDGVEMARRSYGSFGSAQLREDFEIMVGDGQPSSPPGTVSAKFSRPPNEKTTELYRQAADAERTKDAKKLFETVSEIVKADPEDYIAWAKLGSIHFERKAYAEADAAFRRSLEINVEYTPAWISAGNLRMIQKQYAAAIEVLKHAISLDPTIARAHQMLGECYLQTKQGSLGAEALNNAIRLDPSGMSDCHLQLAHLYQLAGAKQLAAKEYKMFLEKRPEHPDKQKFEKFIKENS